MYRNLARLISLLLVFSSAKPIALFAQQPADSKPNSQSQSHKHQETNLEFFTINGQPPLPYLPARSSVAGFMLPVSKSPETFLVNEAIDIQIEPKVLETPWIKAHNSTIPDARFIWDFGDGSRGAGLTNRHIYSKAGSYILGVYIESKLFDSPQLYKTVLIHVLPNKDYQLPKAVIRVNRQLVTENAQDALKTSFREPVQLDGTKSIPGSAQITDYEWDLSDRTLSKEAALNHTYNQASYNATPILRVRDKNGLISDTYVEIINLDTSGQTKKTSDLGSRSKIP